MFFTTWLTLQLSIAGYCIKKHADRGLVVVGTCDSKLKSFWNITKQPKWWTSWKGTGTSYKIAKRKVLHQEVCCLFQEDILWYLCCCNRLRLWGGAGQLVYIPIFSLVHVHHERIAHMWHLSSFGQGKAIYELPDWGMDVKFSFQASMGCLSVVVCFVNAAYCELVHAPDLWRKECGASSTVVTSRSADIIVFQPVQDGCEFVRQLVG